MKDRHPKQIGSQSGALSGTYTISGYADTQLRQCPSQCC